MASLAPAVADPKPLRSRGWSLLFERTIVELAQFGCRCPASRSVNPVPPGQSGKTRDTATCRNLRVHAQNKKQERVKDKRKEPERGEGVRSTIVVEVLQDSGT